MTCNACGEKPKNTAKDFTKAVIEINNPDEAIVLLRKVVIPASMGTEEQVPAAIGKYHNVILYYEANKHVYLYSSDGIPTLLEVDIPQELWDRIEALEEGLDDEEEIRSTEDARLQQEIDDLKNSPDVVDIVATYADLQAYDTSDLGDKDVIRVLADETHDDESSYYRWSTTTQTWTFIGATGPYYTKDETDALLDDKQDTLTAGDGINILNDEISATNTGKMIELTTADYNWNYNTSTETNPNCVALWKLEKGLYTWENSPSSGPKILPASNAQISASVGVDTGYMFTSALVTEYSDGKSIFLFGRIRSINSLGSTAYVCEIGNALLPSGVAYQSYTLDSTSVVNDLTNNSSERPLSALQGSVLNGRIGDLSTLQTTDKTSTVAAINELVASGGGPTVVQTAGASTTDVMSQNATTSMVFADPDWRYKVQIGDGSNANGSGSIAIGQNSTASSAGGIAIGHTAQASDARSVALGTGAYAARSAGQVDIGTYRAQGQGYRGSNYRILTGVYDPEQDHDAATKGYVDSVTPTITMQTTDPGEGQPLAVNNFIAVYQ